MELTDKIIGQILFLDKHKFQLNQIQLLTGISAGRIKRIINAKNVNKKEICKTFDWGNYKDGVL